ncbi:GTPase-activating protein gyp1 [Termitomyces sp. T112]|nr:GTPase-activating protein gyp1 [Termitomyces sp. T112]KAH0588872.1 hypothetical protein H2248_004662 [Termitomyces sp. 'cryptogamus']
MAARPPPARPHIGINPSSHFNPRGISEWGEDDAWDSGSDSESPRQSSLTKSWNHTRTSPKPVPKANNNSSSPTLAFSYTHGGWTIVKTSNGRAPDNGDASGEDSFEQLEGHGDADVEGDMILGDLETDLPQKQNQVSTKAKRGQGIVREDVDDVVFDPFNGIKHRARRSDKLTQPEGRSRGAVLNDPPAVRERSEKLLRERSIRSNRRHKFLDCLSSQDVNIVELRKLAWAGIPADLRPMAWQLLLGYLPLPTPLRSPTLARKRNEYLSLVEVAFARDREGLDQQIWHQIEIDVPRTRPGVRLWMYSTTQRSLERILYVWAIRHPASGYVQGINDLVTPFFQVFLSAYIDSDPEIFDPSHLSTNVLNAIEADSFWCLSRLLDGIQDNYIFAQPGIQRSVRRMTELVARIDVPLSAHLESQNVEFMQFAFRWMNCLLMREISVQNTIRMWDTYLAEGPDAFSQFHLYVCSAFLVKWSEKLRQMDFQGIIMFLQSLPTQDWGDHEIEMLLSEAFVLNSIWQNAQSHFGGK